jgi:glycosyltransferase involved in cell wall biosynthesis
MARRISPAADAAAFFRLKRYFQRRRLDLVHTHTNKAGILGCWAARAARVPRVATTIHGFYFHERMNPAVRALFIQLYRETFRFVDRVFLQSAEDVQTAVRLRIARDAQLVHIGNGIDLDRFDPSRAGLDPEAARLRQSIGVPDSATLIGIVSRVNQEKGFSELLGAVRTLVRDRKRDVHLVAIGDGPARPLYERKAQVFGIASRVHFVGFREDIPEWLTAMDMFALPSYREGFPRSLCEAFAMGTPVVSTRIRGSRELIRDGDTGLLVEPGDEGSLFSALDALVRDTSLGVGLAHRARRHTLRYLDERRVIQKILAVYHELGLEPEQADGGRTEGFPHTAEKSVYSEQREGVEAT